MVVGNRSQREGRLPHSPREVEVSMSIGRPDRNRNARGLEVGPDGSMKLPATQHLLTEVGEPSISRLLFGDTRMAWLWLLVRLYVGWQWMFAVRPMPTKGADDPPPPSSEGSGRGITPS